MSNQKHTPGPWALKRDTEFKEGKIKEYYWIADRIMDSQVISCKIPNEADARLIAAAPELLEALEHILSVWALGPRSSQLAKDAIKKAKGE